MATTVGAPGVSLRNVHVQDVDFSGQTFLLGFGVTNPNPFPLPIKSVSYGVELDGQHFAGGRTESAFTVAAQGDAEFAISVKLDLLRTAPQLLYIVHDAVTRDIPYTLKGELGIDIPLVKPIDFEATGEIRLYASQF
jgi:LEA14-like dessication related protein